jgi:hypothetical protein
MKRIGLLLVFATLISTFSFGQKDAIASFFGDYMDDDRFTSVSIGPKLFSMVSKVTPEDMDPEVRELINKLERLRILTADLDDGMSYFRDAEKRINRKEYEELMVVKEGRNEEVLFLVKEKGDIIYELLMISGSEDDFTLISFIGDLDLNVLAKLTKDLDIDGIEHFEDLEDNREKN